MGEVVRANTAEVTGVWVVWGASTREGACRFVASTVCGERVENDEAVVVVNVCGKGGEEELAVGEECARVCVVVGVVATFCHVASVQFFGDVENLFVMPGVEGEFVKLAS